MILESIVLNNIKGDFGNVIFTMTGLFNLGGKAVSLAHHRTFSTRSQRNPRLISKKIFPYFLIPLETCYY